MSLTQKPLCCTWTHRGLLPPSLKDQFGDLDQLIRETIISAKSRLLVVAPYVSAAGMNLLRESLAVAVANGAWIRVLTGDLDANGALNRKALETLFRGDGGARLRERVRVLVCSDRLPVLFHAKLVIADAERGYIGSANVSASAMGENFEIGCALGAKQAESMDKLVDFLEAKGFVVDQSSAF